MPKRGREAVVSRLEERERDEEKKEMVARERKEEREEKKRVEEKKAEESMAEWKGELRRLTLKNFQVMKSEVKLKDEAGITQSASFNVKAISTKEIESPLQSNSTICPDPSLPSHQQSNG